MTTANVIFCAVVIAVCAISQVKLCDRLAHRQQSGSGKNR